MLRDRETYDEHVTESVGGREGAATVAASSRPLPGLPVPGKRHLKHRTPVLSWLKHIRELKKAYRTQVEALV